MRAIDVNWVLNPGGTVSLSGDTSVFTDIYPWVPQSPGAFTAPISGYYTTNNAFTTAISFGAKPNYPGRPGTDQGAAAYAQWADVDLPASAAAQNHIVAANTGTYAPSFATPSVRPPLTPVPPSPGSAPGVFGGWAMDDKLTVDDDENFPDPLAGYAQFAMRDYRVAFWTNTTNPTPGVKEPPYFPNGATVNQATGQFDANVIGTGSYVNWDIYLPNFLGGGLLGRNPIRGTDPNHFGPYSVIGPATTPGVIGRSGAAYTMSISEGLHLFASGVDRRDGVDLYLQLDLVLTAKANLRPGDTNFDGIVDVSDIQVIAANYLQTGALRAGNANGDNIVDVSDIQLIAANYLQTTPPLPGGGAAASVPEPATLMLAVMAGLGLLVPARKTRVGPH
ncbi:MAG: hypothetical protein HYX69_03230 [Planctomycetia bacterium]|nr:hypothetical protein [Planctomycetia bacterium]